MPNVNSTNLLEPFEDPFGLGDQKAIYGVEDRRDLTVDRLVSSQYGWSNKRISRRSMVRHDLRLTDKENVAKGVFPIGCSPSGCQGSQ